jgi:hypothetical protein
LARKHKKHALLSFFLENYPIIIDYEAIVNTILTIQQGRLMKKRNIKDLTTLQILEHPDPEAYPPYLQLPSCAISGMKSAP